MPTKPVVRLVAALATSLAMGANAGAGDVEPSKPLKDLAKSTVKVTFAGTSTLLFEDGDNKVLIDGFFTRPSRPRVFFGELRTDRCQVEEALDRLRVRTLDVVAVVHSHYDHALDAAFVAACTRATLFGSQSTGMTAPEGQEFEVFQHGVEKEAGKFRITPLKSLHSPMIPITDDLGQTIHHRLTQPVRATAYKEGGSYDLLISHGDLRILVTPSANFDPHIPRVAADIVFLGVGRLGRQPEPYWHAYYEHAVDEKRTQIIVPVHWDNFFEPLSRGLERMPWPFDDVDKALAFVKAKANGKKRVIELGAFQTLSMDGQVNTLARAGLPKGRCDCAP